MHAPTAPLRPLAAAFLFGGLGAASGLAQDAAADWPCYLGPAGNSTSTETGLAARWPDAGPATLWTAELGPGYGGAAVRDGEVFVFDRIQAEADLLRVLDLESGAELWRWRHEAPGRFDYMGSRSVPAVTEGHVYVTGAFGHVHCIDRESREAVWSVHLVDDFDGVTPGYGFVASPVLFEDLLIVTPMAKDAGLVALNRHTGEEVWRTGDLGTSHSTPTLMDLGGTAQIVFLSAKGVPVGGPNMFSRGGENRSAPTAEELAERRRRWERAREEGARSGRSSGGGLTSSRFKDGVGSVASFDVRSGAPLWSTDLYFCWQPVCPPLQIDETRVFLTGGYRSGSLMIEVTRGEDDAFAVRELFRNSRGSHIHPPILLDDHLYVLVNENFNTHRSRHGEGGLLCLDLAGNERWRTGAEPFFGRGNALAAGGVLYIQDGHSGVLRSVAPDPERYHQLAEANVFGTENLRRDYRMWAPMALAGGLLLMRSQEELHCLELRAPAQAGR